MFAFGWFENRLVHQCSQDLALVNALSPPLFTHTTFAALHTTYYGLCAFLCRICACLCLVPAAFALFAFHLALSPPFCTTSLPPHTAHLHCRHFTFTSILTATLTAIPLLPPFIDWWTILVVGWDRFPTFLLDSFIASCLYLPCHAAACFCACVVCFIFGRHGFLAFLWDSVLWTRQLIHVCVYCKQTSPPLACFLPLTLLGTGHLPYLPTFLPNWWVIGRDG